MKKPYDSRLLNFLTGLGLVIVIVILHTLGWLKPIESLFLGVGSSVSRNFYSAGNRTSGFFDFWGSIGSLREENKNLKNEVIDLKTKIAALGEAQRENDLLREQLAYTRVSSFKTIPSFIVGRDSNNLLQYFVINRGEKDGVKVNMPVIFSRGLLVGRVVETYRSTAKVLLAVDSSSVIPAIVQNTSRPSGLIKGEHGTGLLMETIPQDKTLNKGDLVITSGLGGDFPKGLVIGQVEEVKNSDNQLFKEARVQPLVDFNKLEMVFVIREHNE